MSSAEPSSSAAPPRSWRWDDYVLDTGRYELRCGDTVIRVEPQVFDVLTQLVSNHERFVSKEELFDAVWGGRFVGEAALTSRIKAVRRALGDDGEHLAKRKQSTPIRSLREAGKTAEDARALAGFGHWSPPSCPPL